MCDTPYVLYTTNILEKAVGKQKSAVAIILFRLCIYQIPSVLSRDEII